MGARWFEEGRLPSERELRASFKGVPVDPQTGYPAGFLAMAVELEVRRAAGGRTELRELELADGKRVRVAVTICPPGRAEGSEPEPPRRKPPKRGRGHVRRHA